MDSYTKESLVTRERNIMASVLQSLVEHIDEDALLEIAISAHEGRITKNDHLRVHTDLLRVLAIQEALTTHRKRIKYEDTKEIRI